MIKYYKSVIIRKKIYPFLNICKDKFKKKDYQIDYIPLIKCKYFMIK